MGVSQSEFERIIHEVARERFWSVDINGTDVYLTYNTHKHTYTRHFDFNDCGTITGKCMTENSIYPNDSTPYIFASMVYDKMKRLLND